MLNLPPVSPSSPGTLRPYITKPSKPKSITVLGAGAFGSAIGFLLSRQGHDVKVLDIVESRIIGINTVRDDGKRYNPDFLKEYPLPDTFVGVYKPEDAFTAETEYIFSAIPIQFAESYLTKIKPFIYREHIPGFVQTKPLPFVSLSKGITLDKCELIHQVFETVFDINCEIIAQDAKNKKVQEQHGDIKNENHSSIFDTKKQDKKDDIIYTSDSYKIIPLFVSGGSFAEEIALDLPTGYTVACPDITIAEDVATLMSCDETTVCNISTDYLGVQLMGALKNSFAIGAGIIQGLFPNRFNTFSLYITLASAELRRIATTVWGGQDQTALGFAGLGDFILSCSGPSRNRSVGMELAQGLKMSEILAKSAGVCEGVPTTAALHKYLLEKEVLRQFPIVRAINAVVHCNQPAKEAFEFLFSLPPQYE